MQKALKSKGGANGSIQPSRNRARQRLDADRLVTGKPRARPRPAARRVGCGRAASQRTHQSRCRLFQSPAHRSGIRRATRRLRTAALGCVVIVAQPKASKRNRLSNRKRTDQSLHSIELHSARTSHQVLTMRARLPSQSLLRNCDCNSSWFRRGPIPTRCCNSNRRLHQTTRSNTAPVRMKASPTSQSE